MSTTLLVHMPVIGSFAPSKPSFADLPSFSCWSHKDRRRFYNQTKTHVIEDEPCLQLLSPFHSLEGSSNNLPLLKQRIRDREVSWPSSFTITGEFTYLELYWEWLEDIISSYQLLLTKAQIYDAVTTSLFIYDKCSNVIRHFCEHWSPSTNTFFTSSGEESISLWDLKELGGLPITGLFYDEVVPSAKELTGHDNHGKHLPRSCQYLFHAYHILSHSSNNRQEVTIEEWIKFWFTGLSRYKKPPCKDPNYRRTSAPKKTFCPSGMLGAPLTHDRIWQKPFISLGVTNHALQDEIYLAAFLSCWLCKFVLPIGTPNLIRPSTFKIASMMSVGEGFCLAVPVLSKIYNGLHEISTATDLKKCNACFPAHYVYSWIAAKYDTHFIENEKCGGLAGMANYGGVRMARYYNPTEVEYLFNNRDHVPKHQIFPRKERTLIDNDSLNTSDPWREYFISLRCGFLTFRCKDSFYAESYNPHRFSRQFGFCQEVPGNLQVYINNVTLKEVVRHWGFLLKVDSNETVTVPGALCKEPFDATKKYIDWWSNEWLQLNDKNLLGPMPNLLKSSKKPKNTSAAPTKIPSDKVKEQDLKRKQKPAVDTPNKKSSKHKEGSGASNPYASSCSLKKNVNVDIDDDESTSNSDRCWKRTRAEKDLDLVTDLDALDAIPRSSYFKSPSKVNPFTFF